MRLTRFAPNNLCQASTLQQKSPLLISGARELHESLSNVSQCTGATWLKERVVRRQQFLIDNGPGISNLSRYSLPLSLR